MNAACNIIKSIIRAKPALRHILCLFFIVMLIFIAGYILLFAVSLIPVELFKKNLVESYSKGYLYDFFPAGYMSFMGKNINMWDDCVGATLALNMKPEVKSLFRSDYHGNCDVLRQVIDRDFDAQLHPYMRYIHGYSIVLKPLYTLFNVKTSRIIVNSISFALLALFFVFLARKAGILVSVLILAAFFLTKSQDVFLTVTHAVQFWIVLLSAMGAVLFKKKLPPICLFGIIGALDGFFSFLSMGSLSLSLPLLCAAIVKWNDDEDPYNISAFMFWSCMGWAVGFAGQWLLKWGILFFVFGYTKDDIFGVVASQYVVSNINMILIALKNNVLETKWLAGLIILALLIIYKLWARIKFPQGLWVIIWPILVPVIWICIIPGQSGVMHSWFVNIILWPCYAALFLLFAMTPRHAGQNRNHL